MSTDAEPGKETALQVVPKDIDEVTDVEEEATDGVAGGFEYLDNECSSRQQTSFDAVRFDRTSRSFDRKYALRGRYAFDVDDLPMPSRPGKQTVRDGDKLPQVGMARARGSSIDDDLETGKMKAKRQTGKLLLIIESRPDRRRTFHTIM